MDLLDEDLDRQSGHKKPTLRRKVTVRMTVQLYERVLIASKRANRSVNSYINSAIDDTTAFHDRNYRKVHRM